MTDGTALRGTPLFASRLLARAWRKVLAHAGVALLVSGALLLQVGASGCAGNESRQFTRELAPLVGRADKAYFVEKYGEPLRRTPVDATTEVWDYRFGEESLNDYASRGNLTTSTLLRLTFRNGILSTFQASNTLR